MLLFNRRGGGAGGGGPDALWDKVILLLGETGNDEAQDMSDESLDARVDDIWTGDAKVDTAQSKFGTRSLRFDGTVDAIRWPHTSNDLSVATGQGDWTIECWFRFDDLLATRTIACGRDGGGAEEFTLSVNTDARIRLVGWGAGVPRVNLENGVILLSPDTWYHVAGCRIGTTWTVYIDGVLEDTAVESGTVSTGSWLDIGKDAKDTGRNFKGWIDEFRFTKGVGGARYTGNFTPPTQAFPRTG